MILINWKNRDLRGAVQLGTILEEKGYEVLYSNHDNALWNIYKNNPNFVIFPQIIAEKDKAILAKKIGASNIVIRSEGVVTKKSVHTVFNFDPTVDFNELCDLYIVWGKGMRDLFLEHTNLEPSKIKICGNPRFDIYREPLSSLLSNQLILKKTKLDIHKPIILFAAGFPYLDKDKKMGKKNYGEAYEFFIEFQKRLFKKTITILEEYFSKNPQVQLLIKPHPLELVEKYKGISKYENIDIIEDIDTSLILNEICILLHSSSTMSTEAVMLDKPVITMAFETIDDDFYVENIKYLPTAHNYEEFENLVNKYLKEGKMENEFKIKQLEFIENWFYKIDGNSTLRCANEIDKFIKNTKMYHKKQKLNLFDYYNILKTTPPITNLIYFLSYIKRLGKSYYVKILKREKCSKKDIKKMKEIIREIYIKSNYAQEMN